MGHTRGKTPSLGERISAGVKVGVGQEGSAVLDRIARLDSPVVQGTPSRPARSLDDAIQPPNSEAEAVDSVPNMLEGTPSFCGMGEGHGVQARLDS